MSIINMLRGGVGNGNDQNTYTQNMYPRPDLTGCNMPEKIGWEYSKDSVHATHRWNSCDCWNAGAIKRAKDADSGTDGCCLEVGDEIPLVWIPNRATLEGITLTVNSGIEGVELGVKRYKVGCDDMVIADASLVGTVLAGSDAGPLESTVIDQAAIDALGCGDRLPMDQFCQQCNGSGCHYEHWFASRILIGGCDYEGQYLSLVIEALPDDFDCNSCCLDICLGARLRIPYCGD